jgi:transcriptional regulator with XRE-family HTH domain
MTLSDLRKQKSLTRTELAAKVGVSESYIFHLERGVRKPSHDTMIKLAEALGVSERDFYSFMRSFSNNESQIQ